MGHVILSLILLMLTACGLKTSPYSNIADYRPEIPSKETLKQPGTDDSDKEKKK